MSIPNHSFPIKLTPSGTVNSRYPDGNDGSSAIPLTWAAIPSSLNNPQGTPVSFNLRHYLTEPGSPPATLALIGNLPGGWSLSGDNVTYSGAGTGTAPIQATATRNGFVATSGFFTISSVAISLPDTTPPTTVTGTTLTLVGQTGALVSWDAASDIFIPGSTSSGLKDYQVYRNGSPVGSPVAAPGPGLTLGLSMQTIGSPSPATSGVSQSNADYTFTCGGSADGIFSTADSLAYDCVQVTGPFTMIGEVDFTTATNAFAKVGLMIRASLDPAAAFLHCIKFPDSSGNGVKVEYRGSAGSAVQSGGSFGIVGRQLLRVDRNGNTMTGSYWVSGKWNVLTSVSIGMTDPVYVGIAGNSLAAGQSITTTVRNCNIQNIAGSTYTDSGLTQGSTYNYTAISRDIANNTAASGASASITIPAVANQGQPFPRFYVQAGDGQQLPRSDAAIKALAVYPMIQLGGPFAGAVNAPFSRDYIVQGLKSYVGVDSFHAQAPIVVQYDIAEYANPNLPEWIAATNTNNWWLRTTYPGGSIVSSGDGQQIVAIPYNADGATGLTAAQWMAQFMTDRYMKTRVGTLSTNTSFSAMGSTHLDGQYMDNMAYAIGAGDWLHLGSSQSPNSQAVFNAFHTGTAAYAAKWRALNPGKYCIGNLSFGYANTTNYANPVINTSAAKGIFDFNMDQWTVGRGNSSVFTYSGWINAADSCWTRYTLAQSASANGISVITGAFASTDFALMGSSLCMALMKNGYMCAGINTISDPYTDFIDGNNSATYPVCDEMFGGTLRNPAYLGYPKATAQGAEQTSAWQSGVYRRDFDNGISLWNPSGAQQTVTLEAQYWRLKSIYGNQTINDGTSVGPGNFIIPGGPYNNSANDRVGVILLRAQPPVS